MRPWSLSRSTWTLRSGRRGVERGCDLAPQTELVLLHGKHEVGPVARDRVRDGGITSDGVDGHERAREHAGGVPGGVVVTALLDVAERGAGEQVNRPMPRIAMVKGRSAATSR